MALLLGAPSAHAQRAEPVGFRAPSSLHASPSVSLGSLSETPHFRPERIVFGAFIGAVIGAPLGAVLAHGACEGPDCDAWKDGFAGGAAVGALLGAVFGLIAALPPRAE